MSKVSSCVLTDIEQLLDRIENVFTVFHSLEADHIQPSQSNTASKLMTCMRKTTRLYNSAQENGSIPTQIHRAEYRDAMSRWNAEVDHLAWSLFGHDIKHTCKEENRMLRINSKLTHIYYMLKMYIPGKC